MSSIKLSSGQTIPPIGLGFFLIPPNETAEVAYQGLKIGFRLLDTAQIYGNEKEVGEGVMRWIKEDPEHNKREDVIYTSKIWNSSHGYEDAKASIDESLRKIPGLKYIDIMLIHQPYTNAGLRHGTWKALEEAVAEGKVKSIGISNYSIANTKELLGYPDLKVKPALTQMELHPGMIRKELTDYLKKNNILAEAYSPLMHSNRLDDKDLTELAEKYGKTTSQVLLRWSIQMGFLPIPKSTHIERIKEDFDVFDFELTDAEVKKLADWDNYYPFHWDFTSPWTAVFMFPFVVSRYFTAWKRAIFG